MQFINHKNNSEGFKTRNVGEWNINSCPVSSNHLNGDWLVFETQGRLYQVDTTSNDRATKLSESTVRQKHPVIATNRSGYRLIAWGEANGYFAGGLLAVQLYNPDHYCPVNFQKSSA